MVTLMLLISCAEIVFGMYMTHINCFRLIAEFRVNINCTFEICKWIEFIQMEEKSMHVNSQKLHIKNRNVSHFWMLIPHSV